MTPHEPYYKDAYKRIMGSDPTPAQIARLDRIRRALRLRDDDAVWIFIFVCDYYAALINGGVIQLNTLIQSAESRTRIGWRAVVGFLTRPIGLACAVAAVCIAALAGAAGVTMTSSMVGNLIATLQREGEITVEHALAQNQQIIAARVAERVAHFNELSVINDDPNYINIIVAIKALPLDEKQRLASDPKALKRVLHVFSSLSRQGQAAFELANEPDTHQNVQDPAFWFAGKIISGDSAASRLLAAFAARNARLSETLGKLSPECDLTNLAKCQ